MIGSTAEMGGRSGEIETVLQQELPKPGTLGDRKLTGDVFRPGAVFGDTVFVRMTLPLRRYRVGLQPLRVIAVNERIEAGIVVLSR